MLKVYENDLYRYERHGTDIWGRPVYAAYLKGPDGERFIGYRYRRTQKEIARLRRQYGPQVGIGVWEDCPAWCVQERK